MHIDTFIIAALRRDGLDPQMAHNAGIVRGLRQGIRFLTMIGWSIERPDPCTLLVLGCLVGGTGGLGWREYDVPRAPAQKVPALMRLWCARLPTWSPEEAFDAFMKVAPFGANSAWVALLVYQWLKHSWDDPVMPPNALRVRRG